MITIACMIGKSRMKGEKVVTNLVPYGPEKPRSGMVKMASTNQVCSKKILFVKTSDGKRNMDALLGI